MPIWTTAPISRHKPRMIQLMVLFLTLFGGDAATAGALQRAELTDGRLTLQFAEPVGEVATFALDGPPRLALDIAGAEPGAAIAASSDAVARVRQGRSSGNILRLVLDLGQPQGIADIRHSADGRQLTVTFADADVSQFRGAVRAGLRAFSSPIADAPTLAMARRETARYQVSVPIGRPLRETPLPRIYGPADRALPLVVIDPGHGGHDPGAIAQQGGVREGQINLAAALRVRDSLVSSGRVRVALTRETDRFLTLDERYLIARRLNANLFVSLHADASPNPDATGASIYTLSEVASDREAARLAARENRSNILNGVDLGNSSSDLRSILIDLTQRETMNLSADFARTLQRAAGSDIPFRNAPHRFAGFVVLKAPDMPSVLIEMGFVTNTEDAARISGVAGQQAIARGIRQAVLTHFARQISNAVDSDQRTSGQLAAR